MGWLLSLTLAGALAAPVLPATEAALDACGRRNRFETFHIEMQIPKKSYRVGETVRLPITITRPAHRDPFQGEPDVEFDPPHSEPAEGVEVRVNLWSKNQLPNGATGPLTDADGTTIVEIVLDKRNRKGVYAANVDAAITYPEAACVDPEEYGWRQYENPLLVQG